MGFEVRALGVNLFASGKLALVDAAAFGDSSSRRGRSQAQRRQRSDGSVPARLAAEFGDVVRSSRGGIDRRRRQDFSVVGAVPAGRRSRLEGRNHRGADGFGTGRRSEKLTSRRLVVMVIESDGSSMMRAMVVTAGTTAGTAGTTVVRMNPQRRVQVAETVPRTATGP